MTDKKNEAAKTKEAGDSLVPVPMSPNPEVLAQAMRRRFTAEYKLRILQQAEARSAEPGKVGELLRHEGLYASNLTTWRRQRDEGVLTALGAKKRGRKKAVRNPLIDENETLRRENERLMERLRRAEIIIDVQKKVSQMLGEPVTTNREGDND